MANLKNTSIIDTGFLQLPVGTTAQRPTPAAGQMRFNTTPGNVTEVYDNNDQTWKNLENKPISSLAVGGNVFDTTINGEIFRVHEFYNVGNSNFTVSQAISVSYLIVAGGGGGGSTGDIQAGGGGGAGGVLTGTTTLSPETYTITVGAGGNPGDSSRTWDGFNGSNSSAFGFTAIGGGGGGGQQDRSGRAGGSGGGRSSGGGSGSGGEGTAGQGNRGGNGNASGGTSNNSPFNSAGGGGAGGIGGDSTSLDKPPSGGIGIANSITGNTLYYAGGGGAGQRNVGTGRGFGGYGGGGTGGDRSGNRAENGVPGSGGGGGGGQGDSSEINGGAGGSGIVIIRYKIGTA